MPDSDSGSCTVVFRDDLCFLLHNTRVLDYVPVGHKRARTLVKNASAFVCVVNVDEYRKMVTMRGGRGRGDQGGRRNAG